MNSDIAIILRILDINERLDEVCQEFRLKIKDRPEIVEIDEKMSKLFQHSYELERRAADAMVKFDELKEQYFEQKDLAEKYNEQVVDELSEAELLELNANLEKIIEKLDTFDKEIAKCNEEVEAVLSEHEQAKAEFMQAKKRYDEIVETAIMKESPEFMYLRTKQQSFIKRADERLLKACKKLEQDGVTPVIVKAQDDICCGCKGKLNPKSKKMLKENEFSKCNCCGRLVYTGELSEYKDTFEMISEELYNLENNSIEDKAREGVNEGARDEREGVNEEEDECIDSDMSIQTMIRFEIYHAIKKHEGLIDIQNKYRRFMHLVNISIVISNILTTTYLTQIDKICEISEIMCESANKSPEYSAHMRLIYKDTERFLRKMTQDELDDVCELIFGVEL